MKKLILTISAVLFLTSCDKDEYESPYDECGCWETTYKGYLTSRGEEGKVYFDYKIDTFTRVDCQDEKEEMTNGQVTYSIKCR
jgi:hypothetical protein